MAHETDEPTNPDTSNTLPTPDSSDNTVPANVDNEESAFAPDSELSKEEYFVTDMDTTDYVAESVKKKRVKTALYIIGGIVVLAAIGAIAYFGLKPVSGPAEPVVEASTSAAPSTAPETGVEEPKSPLAALLPAPIDVVPGKVDVQVTGNTIKTNDNLLTIAGAEITPSSTPCDVSDITDFCLVGDVKIGTDTAPIYVLKDAAHSRLFEQPTTFKKVDINGATAAGEMQITFGVNKTVNVIALVNKDGSGYMVMFPNASEETLKNFKTALSVN